MRLTFCLAADRWRRMRKWPRSPPSVRDATLGNLGHPIIFSFASVLRLFSIAGIDALMQNAPIMTNTPDRAELLSRIEARYQRDVDRAARERDAAKAAIDNLNPSVLSILASLLSEQVNTFYDSPSQLLNGEMRIDSSGDDADHCRDDEDETLSSSYGDVTNNIRQIVRELHGDFTARDIAAASTTPMKPSTISGVLKKLEREGVVKLLEQGAGKRPSKFRRALPDI
ncbi:MAG: helix-turn-helix domain-containing protein [Planctomycetaceae bacterium]|nr:helix-turn-helix domain-containing protein [Planctomycetaceae bacterium]